MSIDTFDDKARELADFTNGVRFLMDRLRQCLDEGSMPTEEEQEIINLLGAWHHGWVSERRKGHE